MRIVLATHNRDKAREISRMLGGLDLEIDTLDSYPDAPEPVEDGDSLQENALIKSRAIRDATGVSALADDTGLEVEALDGAPGIYAARFAGENATYDDNCNKLLDEMRGVPEDERGARFRTVMALSLIDADAIEAARELISEGMLPGRIATEKSGDGGFGYDPVFIDSASGRSLAEMTLDEKNETSHRYRALIEMRELLLRLGLAKEV